MTEDEIIKVIKKMQRRHEMLIKFCLFIMFCFALIFICID